MSSGGRPRSRSIRLCCSSSVDVVGAALLSDDDVVRAIEGSGEELEARDGEVELLTPDVVESDAIVLGSPPLIEVVDVVGV